MKLFSLFCRLCETRKIRTCAGLARNFYPTFGNFVNVILYNIIPILWVKVNGTTVVETDIACDM